MGTLSTNQIGQAMMEKVAGEFCAEHDLDRKDFTIRMSKGRNLIMEGPSQDYVLSMSGDLLQVKPKAIALTPYADEGSRIPAKVVRTVRADAQRLRMLDDWKWSLVSRICVTQEGNGMRLRVHLVPQGGRQALVEFPDLVIGRPYPDEVASRLQSFEDEIQYLEGQIRDAPYRLTEVGEERIRTACYEAARELYATIAPSYEILRNRNKRYGGLGGLVLDGLGSAYPNVMPPNLPAIWGSLSSHGNGFLNPWNVCCEIGSAHACYDLRTRRVWFDDHEIQQARLHARRLAYDAKYEEIESAVRRRFPRNPLYFDITGDTDLTIRVADAVAVTRVIKMEAYSTGQLEGILDTLERQVMKGRRKRCGSWGDPRNLVGALLPMAIMQFLIDNQETPVRNRITRGVVVKAMRGHPLETFVGMARPPLFERMGAYEEEEIRYAFEGLCQNRLITLRKHGWKGRTYDIAFPITNPTAKFMRESHADAEEGTPAGEMTEWQLLQLLDQDVASRPLERLATELPVLIDHPACYFADPERFVAYAKSLPDALQDYIRVSRSMTGDGMQRMMLDALVAELGEALSTDMGADSDDDGWDGDERADGTWTGDGTWEGDDAARQSRR